MSTPSTAALQEVADWLAECIDCGREHHERAVNWNDDGTVRRGTWADPVDGHGYRRRDRCNNFSNTYVNVVDLLRNAALQEAAQQ